MVRLYEPWAWGVMWTTFLCVKTTYEIFLGSKAAVGGLAHDGVGNSVETRADLVDPVASLPPPARIPVIGCASGREGSTWADGDALPAPSRVSRRMQKYCALYGFEARYRDFHLRVLVYHHESRVTRRSDLSIKRTDRSYDEILRSRKTVLLTRADYLKLRV